VGADTRRRRLDLPGGGSGVAAGGGLGGHAGGMVTGAAERVGGSGRGDDVLGGERAAAEAKVWCVCGGVCGKRGFDGRWVGIGF